MNGNVDPVIVSTRQGPAGSLKGKQPQQVRRNQQQQQQQQQQQRLLVVRVVVICSAVWGVFLWRVNSLLPLVPSPSSGKAPLGPQLLPLARSQLVFQKGLENIVAVPEISHGSNPQQHRIIETNPYYGWQPVIPKKSVCSWRQCFHNDHSQCASTCRDSPHDLIDPDAEGLPPDVPAVGWIPDATLLHRMRIAGEDARGDPWPPPLPAELCEPMGGNGDSHHDENKQLLDIVPITVSPWEELEEESTPKVLCMIYTMKEQHATNIRAIRETWASWCDGFLAFSTEHDPRIPAISLPHDGIEDYNNMWQKIRSIWKFVGTHYLEEFDFFFQGGEDLFVIPQNLKRYLRDLLQQDGKTADDDYFLGRRFKGYGKNNYFNSGGAGYALSRGTLRKYIHQGGWEDTSKCEARRHTAMEDVMIAKCLRELFHIGLTDTRDSQLRERFHPFAPASHYQWRPPKISKADGGEGDWYADYNVEWPPLLNEMCCAPDSVSFHYIKKPAMVRHLYALLNTCGNR